MPEQYEESIIVPINKKGDKRDCSNYRDVSLLPTTYEIVFNMLLSRLTPYAEEIIGDHQCEFQLNRPTTDHILCVRQILKKIPEFIKAVHHPFIDLKKAFDSFRREILCNILTEFDIRMKLASLIKVYLTETYSRIRVGKNLSYSFPIKSGLKQGDTLSP